MTVPTIYPANDFAIVVTLKDVDAATGKAVPLTTGTVTAFLATTNTPIAGAADPSLSVAATHIGGGKWAIAFDGSVLTAALLAALFGATPPYLIVVATGGVRGYLPLAYAASRPIELVG